MPKVKICGITRLEDAIVAVEGGADYLGFILYPKSPRYVDKPTRLDIVKALPSGVKKVAVMVNPSPDEVLEVFEEGFDLVQLHGDESLDLAYAVGINRVIKAFRIKDEAPLIEEEWRKAHAILLDTYSKGSYGGTGKTFNWEIAKEVKDRNFRIFLSGGLNPSNVKKAVEYVKPFGVDVSSGVEEKPGIKDKAKVLSFIKNAKIKL